MAAAVVPYKANQGGVVTLWVCSAPADPIRVRLERRLTALGAVVSPSPGPSDRAVVVLTPALAEADPPELDQWARERGADGLMLVLASGRADWDDRTGGFAPDANAVPPSLRRTFRSRPIVLDLRGAGQDKLDRAARRLVGAASTNGSTTEVLYKVAPPLPGAASVRPPRWVRRTLGVAIVVLLGLGLSLAFAVRPTHEATEAASMSDEVPPGTTYGDPPGGVGDGLLPYSESPEPAAPPAPTPQAQPQAPSETPTPWVAWALVVLLGLALAVSVGLHLYGRRRRTQRHVVNIDVAGGAPAAGESQVFISHDTEADGKAARTLAEKLAAQRLRPWLAPDSIPPGEAWVFAIERGLTTSKAAIVLLSPAALASGWVRREIQMIVDLEIEGRLYVVPVRVAPCQVPLVLGAYQWVDIGQAEHAVQELNRRFVLAPGAR